MIRLKAAPRNTQEEFQTMKLSTSILAHKLKSKFTLQNKKDMSDKLHLDKV